MIKPLRDKVLIKDFKKGARTIGGIYLRDDDAKVEGIRPRWAQVWKMGEDVNEDYKVGDWILIEHGRWSRPIKVDDGSEEVVFYNIDRKGVILACEEEPSDDFVCDGVPEHMKKTW